MISAPQTQQEEIGARLEKAMNVWFGEPLACLRDRPRGRPAIVVVDPRLDSPRTYVFDDLGMVYLTEEELKPLELRKVAVVNDSGCEILNCCSLARDPGLDGDLVGMSIGQLQSEIMRLRSGIRYHRDQRGDDRCWLDDVKLYKLLPDSDQAEFKLPCREKFLSSCERFWESRQGGKEKELHIW